MIPPVIRYLIEGGHQSPSADNSQPGLFGWDGEVLTVSFDGSGSVEAVFGPKSHCERLTMGAIVENVVQLAESIPIDGEWQINREGPDYLQFQPSELPEGEAWSKQHPIFSRHTNRFKFDTADFVDDSVETVARLTEGGCRVRMILESGQIKELASLVRLGSSLRFRNQQLHEWFGRSLRYSADEVSRGTGLDVATLDLPPGGGLFLKMIMDWRRMRRLNAIGIYRLLSAIEAKAIAQAPGMLVITGPENETFEAGRLMERVWLEMERLKVAVHPYYVITDQLIRLSQNNLPTETLGDAQRLKSASEAFLGNGEFPHMLMRIGRPAKTVVRSKRRPLEQVVLGSE